MAFIGLGAFLASNPSILGDAASQMTYSNPLNLAPGVIGIVLIALGAVFLPLGIISLIVAFGTLKGKGWAWSLTVVISVIGIAMNIISNAFSGFQTSSIVSMVVSVAINLLILYYLYRPHVKTFFGKGIASPAQAQT